MPAGNATAPTTYVFTGNEGYLTCSYCLRYFRGCTSQALSSCAGGRYFSQGGTFTLTTATQNPDAGSFVAQMTNLRFVEWDFSANDRAVPSGRCFVISSEATSVSWP
jgi:hypothetical protein